MESRRLKVYSGVPSCVMHDVEVKNYPVMGCGEILKPGILYATVWVQDNYGTCRRCGAMFNASFLENNFGEKGVEYEVDE